MWWGHIWPPPMSRMRTTRPRWGALCLPHSRPSLSLLPTLRPSPSTCVSFDYINKHPREEHRVSSLIPCIYVGIPTSRVVQRAVFEDDQALRLQ
jgi:hypothetical protein